MNWLTNLWSGKKPAPEKYRCLMLDCRASFENSCERDKHERTCSLRRHHVKKHCRTSLFCTASFENEEERKKHEQNYHGD